MEPPKGIHDLGKLESFPDEIIIEVLKKLDSKSLMKVCSVSKKMNNLCKDNHVWRVLYYRDVSTTPPCLPLNWEQLYKLAVTQDVSLYLVTMDDIEFHVLGEANLDAEVDRFFKDVKGYTDEDLEVFHSDLFIENGDPSISMIVDDEEPYIDDSSSIEIIIIELDGIPVKSIFNLFGRFKATIN